MNSIRNEKYIEILKRELVPAMGCTEPIAVALAGAKTAQVLGGVPDSMNLYLSGNVIKNVKGVIVPNSEGQKGSDVAAVLGAVGGDADSMLEVVSKVTHEHVEKTRELIAAGICRSHLAEGEEDLYVRIEARRNGDTSTVVIKTDPNRFVLIAKNGEALFSQDANGVTESESKDCLNLRDIIEFANELDVDSVREPLDRQIAYNSAISDEGIRNPWSTQVGRTVLSMNDSLVSKCIASAAAGSDARMGGCSMPVVINSGSGNQGITVTTPVVTYACAMGISNDKLYRALALANLISIHQKRFIGNLSAYCGATSAATAAICGIAYMEGADYELLGNTIINSIATIGGMVCDGAKPSCSSKIASAVNTAFTAYEMAKHKRVLSNGDGIVDNGVEGTIENVGRMAREGMRETDVEILRIMIGE